MHVCIVGLLQVRTDGLIRSCLFEKLFSLLGHDYKQPPYSCRSGERIPLGGLIILNKIITLATKAGVFYFMLMKVNRSCSVIYVVALVARIYFAAG